MSNCPKHREWLEKKKNRLARIRAISRTTTPRTVRSGRRPMERGIVRSVTIFHRNVRMQGSATWTRRIVGVIGVRAQKARRSPKG